MGSLSMGSLISTVRPWVRQECVVSRARVQIVDWALPEIWTGCATPAPVLPPPACVSSLTQSLPPPGLTAHAARAKVAVG